jgi:hypothetical protein
MYNDGMYVDGSTLNRKERRKAKKAEHLMLARRGPNFTKPKKKRKKK